jgi:hypothetical protein
MPERRRERDLTSAIQRWLEIWLCIALAALLFWKGIVPAWRTLNTDFPNYYLVARLLREHYQLDQIYDWVWLQRVKDHWGLQQSLVGFAGLTPMSALPVLPLTFFSALAAKRLWIVLNLAMLAAAAELLHRSTTLRRRVVWLVCLLTVVPLRTSFLYGQMHLLVLLLMVLAWFFFSRRNDTACGTCIALAAALKVYPLLFVGYFVLKRRWSAAVTTLFALTLIVGITGALMGREVLHTFAFQQLPRTLQGEVLDPYSVGFASGSSLFHRLFLFEPQLNPSPRFSSPRLYAVLYPLWQMTIAVPLLGLLRPFRPGRDKDEQQVAWAAITLALLTLTPVPSSYHFVVMILPGVLLLDSMLREGALRWATALVLLYAAVSLLGGGLHLPPSARLWLLSALYLLSLSWLWRMAKEEKDHPASRDFVLAIVLGVCGVAISIAGYGRHLAQRNLQLGDRVKTSTPSYLATNPVSTGNDLFYVAMRAAGYRVANQHTDDLLSTVDHTGHGDQLSLSSSSAGTMLVEVADVDGSRIVRSSDGAVVAVDAEMPAISPDGRAMAYIREVRGRGILLVANLLAKGSATALTGEGYDVRQAGFPDTDRLLFVAKHEGHLRLFMAVPGGEPRLFFSATGDIGAFAVSPDARSIVFTELIRDRWQLAVLDTRSSQVRTLTANDCNAYRPTWSAGNEVIYATDCGRGLGLTALAKMAPLR